MNARLRGALTAPLRPFLRSIQVRIDNAVQGADERMQVVATELRAAQATEAAVQHGLRDERLGELRSDLDGRLDDLNDQLRRISAQLVALEHRVGDLERPPVDLVADDAERRVARSLVDEVRLEHDRTRAGLAAIAFYEERIARLERVAKMDAVTDGTSGAG